MEPVIPVGECQYELKDVFDRKCYVPTNIDPPVQELAFLAKKDPDSGKYFYVNLATKAKSWDLPDVTSLPAMPPLEDTLVVGETTYVLLAPGDADPTDLAYAVDNPDGSPAAKEQTWLVKPDRLAGKYMFQNVATRQKVGELPCLAATKKELEVFFQRFPVAEFASLDEGLSKHSGTDLLLLLRGLYGDDPKKVAKEILLSIYEANEKDPSDIGPLIEEYSGKERALVEKVKGENVVCPPSYRQRVAAIYAKHNPAKLGTVNESLKSVEGREVQLIAALNKKYGESSAAASADDDTLSTASAGSGVSHVPPSASVEEYRARAVAMYKEYKPEKLNSVDEGLKKFAGQEHLFIEALVKKYGPEPTAKSSSPPVAEEPPSQEAEATSEPTKPDQDEPSTPEAAEGGEAAADDIDQRVARMYAVYCPEKYHNVDKVLSMYKGQEKRLIDSLIKKYGPEPPADTVLPSKEEDGSEKAATVDAASEDSSEWRRRITAFYERYAPEKTSSVDQVLSLYAGREEELLNALIRKYGPEPEGEAVSTNSQGAASIPPAASDEKPAAPVEEENKTRSPSAGEQSKAPNTEEQVAAEPAAANPDKLKEEENATSSSGSSEDEDEGIQKLSYNERLTRFYTVYNPQKLHTIVTVMTAYEGKEERMMLDLVKKYGPEPTDDEVHKATEENKQNPELQKPITEDEVSSIEDVQKAHLERLMNFYRYHGDRNFPHLLHITKEEVLTELGEYRHNVGDLFSKLKKQFGAGNLEEEEKEVEKAIDEAIKDVEEGKTVVCEEGAEREAAEEPAKPVAVNVAHQEPEHQTARLSPQQQPLEAHVATAEQPAVREAHQDAHVHQQQPIEATASEEPIAATSVSEEQEAQQEEEQHEAPVHVIPTTHDEESESLLAILSRAERKLQEAYDSMDILTKRCDEYRTKNDALSTETEEVHKQCETELRGMRTYVTEVENESQKVLTECELERQRLRNAEELSVTTLLKEVEEQKTLGQRQRLAHLEQSNALQETFHALQVNVHKRETEGVQLDELIQRRDEEVARLEAKVEEMRRRAERGALIRCEIQTDLCIPVEQDILAPSPVKKEPGSLPAKPTAEERTQLETRCVDMEREIELLKDQIRAEEEKECEECGIAVRVIAGLRTKNIKLTTQVEELELQLLSLPDVPLDRSPEQLAVKDMRKQAESLQHELATTQSQSRTFKTEISELRGLLAMHIDMSSPTNRKLRFEEI